MPQTPPPPLGKFKYPFDPTGKISGLAHDIAIDLGTVKYMYHEQISLTLLLI